MPAGTVRGWWLAMVVAALVGAGCGDDAPTGPPNPLRPGPEEPLGGSTTPGEGSGDTTIAGTEVAKEILETFGALVDEVHALVEDKPAAAEVLPKLDEVLGRYETTMKALAQRRAALPDIHAERAVRRHLGEHRPAAVHRRNELLGAFIFHYRGVDVNADVVAALNEKLITLLNLAAN